MVVTWIGHLSVDIPVSGEDYPETQSASLCPTFGFSLNPIYECGNRGARVLEDALVALFPNHLRDEHGDGLQAFP